jgi:5-(carboxyamino)imidazole ribonucleotide mutase
MSLDKKGLFNMKKVKVAVAMGSKSDFSVMKEAAQILDQNGVEVIVEIVSAHRTPGLLEKKSAAWEKAGVRCIIAGAGGAAHLPG